MMLMSAPGVYTPQDDTWLLAQALHREPITADTTVLDVGTGSGVLALEAARRGAAHVTAVDISALAVAAARLHARLSGLRVRVVRGDLLTPVADRRFDLIVANPPYVPSAAGRRGRRGRALAWDAGADGRALLDQICEDGPPRLRPGGVLLLVHSGLCGVDRTLRQLERAGLRAAVADRRLVPFGPVLRERAGWLESRGLIAPGEEKEELVVIRAEQPW
ncbi:HemK2/MTQ2 family protein methyltransferase [Streptomyces sp. NPDC005336]|uniref:HemK2/MTQ2 family protein methyltransferase n=1 Tax=Streptomyces sp. NPDC005336 TaxID=3157035 RepID=UPI00339DBF21